MMAQPLYNTPPTQGADKQQDKQRLEREASQSREQAKEAVDATRERVEQSARESGHEALEELDQRKDRLARGIDDIGDAFDSAVEHLRQARHEHMADYAGRMSRGIHEASDAIRDRSPQQLWQDTSNFARKRPEIVVGGMFAAGLALSRFFKASQPPTQ